MNRRGNRNAVRRVDDDGSKSTAWHRFPLDDHEVLYREGAERVHVLDRAGSWILSRLLEGASRAQTAVRLARRLGIGGADAETMVRRVHDAIVLDSGPSVESADTPGTGAWLSADGVSVVASKRRRHRIAAGIDDWRLTVTTDSSRAASVASMLLGHLARDLHGEPGELIDIEQSPVVFTVRDADGKVTVGDDGALAAHLLAVAVESYLRHVAGLIVLHAAAVAVDEVAVVLLAPSGSGKTTLAGALAGSGHAYLSDDVVPVDAASGAIRPVPMPQCAKSGSWNLLDPAERASASLRLGRPTRYLMPRNFATRPYFEYIIICPRYRRDGTGAACRRLSAVELLAQMAASQSLRTPGLDAGRLERIVEWVPRQRAWSLEFGDTGAAIRCVRALAAAHRRNAAQPGRP